MNELPKSVRDKLAKDQTGLPHPDTDLLTAFSEGSLSVFERQRVMEHIVTCEGCREVIFLATPPIEAAQVVMQVPKRSRIWKWLPPVATFAVLAVGVGIYLQQHSAKPEVQPVLTATTTKPPEPPPITGSTLGAAREQVAVAGPPKSKGAQGPGFKKDEIGDDLRRKRGVVADAGGTGRVAEAPPSRQAVDVTSAGPVVTAQNNAPAAEAQSSSKIVIEAPPGSATVAKARDKEKAAPTQALREDSLTSEVGAAPAYAPRKLANAIPVRPRWRITDTGVLERSYITGEWHPLFEKSKTEFRVVAVVGEHVWAGGAQGEVFHSKDEGVSWKQIELAPQEQRFHAAITSIRFVDDRNGTITLANGDVWATSDEGKSWKKQ